MDTYQNLIFSVCYKITGNYFDSEDLAQDTFLSAYKNFARFDGKNEKAWLCRIATNKCLDYKRKASNSQILTEDSFFEMVQDGQKSIEEQCLEDQVKEKLLQSCQKLKPPYDDIAVRYFYKEYSTADIAKQLDRNEKTVQTQVYRAKAMLRKIYGKE
ncbi:MAG: RNA polymerase sigma factor [Lachnospiraceae bacterium]